jgi:hypothetical protein
MLSGSRCGCRSNRSELCENLGDREDKRQRGKIRRQVGGISGIGCLASVSDEDGGMERKEKKGGVVEYKRQQSGVVRSKGSRGEGSLVVQVEIKEKEKREKEREEDQRWPRPEEDEPKG